MVNTISSLVWFSLKNDRSYRQALTSCKITRLFDEKRKSMQCHYMTYKKCIVVHVNQDQLCNALAASAGHVALGAATALVA